MKAVIFDFDGTLTQKNGNLWKEIWQELGYSVEPNSYYRELFNSFMAGKITHKQWCDLTCVAFKEKGFNKELLKHLTQKTTLISGAEELIHNLYSNGVEVHIVSGNIVSVIQDVLGKNNKYVTSIKANEFVFSPNGIIEQIIGTKYDHEGKANYIKELCQTKGYNPSDILFIGNSMNDEWVYMSGAKTICVNPDNANHKDTKIWNKVIKTDNLLDLEREF